MMNRNDRQRKWARNKNERVRAFSLSLLDNCQCSHPFFYAIPFLLEMVRVSTPTAIDNWPLDTHIHPCASFPSLLLGPPPPPCSLFVLTCRARCRSSLPPIPPPPQPPLNECVISSDVMIRLFVFWVRSPRATVRKPWAVVPDWQDYVFWLFLSQSFNSSFATPSIHTHTLPGCSWPGGLLI